MCLIILSFYTPQEPPKDLLIDQYALKLQKARVMIREVGESFPFPGNKQLSSFTPATNGEPFRSLIISTWRSGSTFTGDILNAMPANYYHFEPAADYKQEQIREDPLGSEMVERTKRLLRCDYSKMEGYLKFVKKSPYFFKLNTRLWQSCGHDRNRWSCFDPIFLSAVCKLFPFQSMKFVRLRVRYAAQLLEDDR